ncbi:hypothetical protein B0A49_08927 [Cryomyces minteri]|uniref:Methyltransferase type 11 domain-containing protein n=1 Tax=Cryomyces minteri TaxID=331657 RepID=A0A4U0W268_9PEZI|nr:hypothetical protein B0A49_08927 [Cryomyces minteri]
MATFAKSTFSHASYAAFRPSYPPSLYNTVLQYHRGPKNLCVDLGCGHGVVARALAPEFSSVLGTDPSKGMIEQAQSSTPKDQYPNVAFRSASAEHMPFLKDESVELVVAGQAAHWFDYAALFPEMRRIMRKGGTLAFWGYKDHIFVDYPRATQILNHYAYSPGKDLLGEYWSQPGRSIVQNKLRAIQPPSTDWEDIRRIEYEPDSNGPASGEGTMFLTKKLKLGECKKYIRTWSAYHGWQEAHPGMKKRSAGGNGDVIDQMFDDIANVVQDFKDEEKEVQIEWGSGLLMARRK